MVDTGRTAAPSLKGSSPLRWLPLALLALYAALDCVLQYGLAATDAASLLHIPPGVIDFIRVCAVPPPPSLPPLAPVTGPSHWPHHCPPLHHSLPNGLLSTSLWFFIVTPLAVVPFAAPPSPPCCPPPPLYVCSPPTSQLRPAPLFNPPFLLPLPPSYPTPPPGHQCLILWEPGWPLPCCPLSHWTPPPPFSPPLLPSLPCPSLSPTPPQPFLSGPRAGPPTPSLPPGPLSMILWKNCADLHLCS